MHAGGPSLLRLTGAQARPTCRRMSQLSFPSGLAEIAARYDVVLCDVWGVIHNGRRAFASACQALVKYREQGGRVVLITNAPVPKARVIRYFDPLGVPQTAWDDCASSGDATRAELVRRADESVWVYGADGGEEHDRFLYEGLPNRLEPSKAADLLLCIGLKDQMADDPEEYRAELKEIAAEGAGPVMVCANPDIQVRVGEHLVWCAGALAAIYEEEGGKVIYPGKPHGAIYRLAYDKAETLLDAVPAKSHILAIGDGPVTDIRGANAQGIDSLYVGTGLAQHDTGDFAEKTAALLQQSGVSATYAMRELKW